MKKPSISLSALAAVVAIGSLSSASAAVVAYYSFDTDFSQTDGSSTISLATVETAGSAVSVSTTVGESQFGGGAASFSSNDSGVAALQLSSDISFSSTDAWSVSFWERRVSTAQSRAGMIIGNVDERDSYIRVDANAGGLEFRDESGTNTPDFDVNAPDGNFNHYVVIADGLGGMTVYRNNVQEGTTQTGQSTDFLISGIGQAHDQARHSMIGQIDEVYIFDEAVDTIRVGQLFAGTFVVPEPSSVGLLSFAGLLLVGRRRRS